MNLKETAAGLDEYWSPRVVARVNGQFVKVAKVLGEFPWHKHDDEDELFLILDGELTIAYEDDTVTLRPGDVHVVPRGRLHHPTCQKECLIALFEPESTKHTGDVETDKTRSVSEQLAGFER